MFDAVYLERRVFMTDLSAFPITSRWPAKNPSLLQLYSFATPNGVKVSIMLEEIGLPYEAHTVSIMQDDQKSPEFLALNPNGKIPAIIDPDGPDGRPLGLFESGAILVYLADKTGKLIPADPRERFETLQWLFFQMGGVGPMFGQFGHFFRFARDKVTDPYPMQRYRDETVRLLAVLDQRLKERQWLMGDDYTIADIALFPWLRTLKVFYEASDILQLERQENVMAWLERCLARPASETGLAIPPRQ